LLQLRQELAAERKLVAELASPSDTINEAVNLERSQSDTAKLRAASHLLSESASQLEDEERVSRRLRSEIQDLRSVLSTTENAESTVVSALQARQATMEKMRMALNEMHDTVQQNEELKKAAEARAQVKQQQIVQLEAQLAEAQAAHHNAIAAAKDVASQNVSVAAAATALQQARNRVAALEGEVTSLRNEITTQSQLPTELAAARATEAQEVEALVSHIRDTEVRTKVEENELRRQLQIAQELHQHDEQVTLKWATELQEASSSAKELEDKLRRKDNEISALHAVQSVRTRGVEAMESDLRDQVVRAQESLDHAAGQLLVEKERSELTSRKLAQAETKIVTAQEHAQQAIRRQEEHTNEAIAAAEVAASRLRRELTEAKQELVEATRRGFEQDEHKRREFAAAIRAECANRFERIRQTQEDRLVRAAAWW